MSDAVGFEGDKKNIKVIRQIESIDRLSTNAIRKTWFSLGRDLKNEANNEIKHGSKTGKTYLIRSRKSAHTRRHVASAPGETHANRTGKLRRAVSWKVHGSDRMEFGYGFDRNKAPEYDAWVEDGTSRMDARPSIENAVNAVKGRTDNHFHRAMLDEFRRV